MGFLAFIGSLVLGIQLYIIFKPVDEADLGKYTKVEMALTIAWILIGLFTHLWYVFSIYYFLVRLSFKVKPAYVGTIASILLTLINIIILCVF